MMALLRLVFEHLNFFRVRTVLMLITVILGFATFAVLGALRFSLNSGSGSVAERRLIVGHEAGLMQTLPMAFRSKLAGIEGAGTISHATWMGTYFREQRNMMMSFAVDGEAWLQTHPDLIVDAKDRAAFLRDRRSILVARPLAEKFGWKVGQVVPLKSVMFAPPAGDNAWPFIMTGTFVTDDTGGGRNYIIAHYDYFNENRVLFKDSVGTFVIMPKPNADPNRLAGAIDAAFAQSAAPTSTSSDRAFHSEFFEQFGNVVRMIQMIIAVTFTSLILVVASGMTLAMRQRRTDLGVLRVLGFSNGRIYFLVAGQVAAIVFGGALLGLALGTGFNRWIVARMPEFLPNISLPAPVLTEALAIAALVTLVTAALPAWLALRVKPAEAFSAEPA